MKEGIIRKCEQIEYEIEVLWKQVSKDYDEDEAEDYWDELEKIVDEIDNLQRGAKLPIDVWMDTLLPSNEEGEDSDFNIFWFKTDIQYTRRGIKKIKDWIANYQEERGVEKKEIDKKETEQSSLADLVEVKKEKKKKKKVHT